MIIVAFSTYTSKKIPNILCRGFKHVALILPAGATDKELVMYQFMRRNNIAQIRIKTRDLAILGAHGWKYIYLATDMRNAPDATRAITCVNYVKHRLGIRNILIQTPMQLYKYLN